MKIPCEKCGKPIDTKGMPNHLKYCKGTLKEPPEQEQIPEPEQQDQNQEQDQGDMQREYSAKDQVDHLANFILAHFSPEIGDEGAVECAIRLLKRQLEVGPPSLPLSICPPELAIMDQRKQTYLDVAGHIKGERFIVELVKLRR